MSKLNLLTGAEEELFQKFAQSYQIPSTSGTTKRRPPHSGSNHKCEACGKTFTRNNTLQRHIQSVHQKKRYSCEFCVKTFCSDYGLYTHIKDRHEGKTASGKHLISGLSDSDDDDEVPSSGQSPNIQGGASHPATMAATVAAAKVAAVNFTPYVPYVPLTKDAKPYGCAICGVSYQESSNLQLHTQEVHQTDKCKTCGKVFSVRSNLQAHIKDAHEGRRYTCKICNNSYYNQSTMKKHIKTIHEGIKYNRFANKPKNTSKFGSKKDKNFKNILFFPGYDPSSL